jgi:hypothetical protein
MTNNRVNVANFDDAAPPIDYLGFIKGQNKGDAGTFPMAKSMLGHTPFYYWQPYECNYRHYDRKAIRKCLIDKGITRFLFSGDSLMMGRGTGFTTTFRELLGGLGDMAKFKESGVLTTEDPDFHYAGLNADGPTHKLFGGYERYGSSGLKEKIKTLQKAGDACPSVIVINFWMNHKMWWYNTSTTIEMMQLEVDDMDEAVAALPDCTHPPRLFFMTPVVYISERQMHLTATRSKKIVEWMQKVLLPRGWTELNYQKLQIARSMDSTCNSDGLHPAHNVRAQLAQALANHLCQTD